MKISISSSKELKQKIDELEQKQAIKKAIIIENAKEFYTTIQPGNLLRTFFNNVTTSSTLQNKILNTAISLGTGAISNKIVSNKNSSVLKKVAGRLIQFGVTGLVAKNAYKIKAVSQAIIQNIFKKKK